MRSADGVRQKERLLAGKSAIGRQCSCRLPYTGLAQNKETQPLKQRRIRTPTRLPPETHPTPPGVITLHTIYMHDYIEITNRNSACGHLRRLSAGQLIDGSQFRFCAIRIWNLASIYWRRICQPKARPCAQSAISQELVRGIYCLRQAQLAARLSLSRKRRAVSRVPSHWHRD